MFFLLLSSSRLPFIRGLEFCLAWNAVVVCINFVFFIFFFSLRLYECSGCLVCIVALGFSVIAHRSNPHFTFETEARTTDAMVKRNPSKTQNKRTKKKKKLNTNTHTHIYLLSVVTWLKCKCACHKSGHSDGCRIEKCLRDVQMRHIRDALPPYKILIYTDAFGQNYRCFWFIIASFRHKTNRVS